MVDFFVCCLKLVLFFIYVGVDIFGYWNVVSRICGGYVNSKWLVILFIYFIVCVVYIEVVE